MVNGDGGRHPAVVRAARAKESAALAALLSQLGHDVPPAWLKGWMSAMNRATDRILVAEQHGEPVGVAVLHVTPFAHEAGTRARLTALGLVPGPPPQGVGAPLPRACD